MTTAHQPFRIALVDLDSDIPNLGQLMGMPRFGIGVIGSLLAREGYPVRIFADAYGKVTPEEILQYRPAVVMFNGIKTVSHRVRALAKTLKFLAPSLPLVYGGEEASLNPAQGEDFADFIIIKEGDKTVLKLVEALEQKKGYSSIEGLRYKEKGIWKDNEIPPRVNPITYQICPELFRNFQKMKKPFLPRHTDITRKGRVLYFPLQTSRGCDRLCSFCTWMTLFGKKGYFERPIAHVMADMKHIIEYSGIRDFMVVDNLYGKRREYALELAKRIIEEFPHPEKRPIFTTLMRADQFGEKGYSEDELAILFQGGLKDVSLGLESVDDKTLKEMRKGLTVNDYVLAIQKLHRAGIRVCGTFAAGGGQDDKGTLERVLVFAREMNLYRLHLYTFSIFTGTPLEKKAPHLIIPGVDHRYMNGHGVMTFPKKMLPSELQELTLETMYRFYSWLKVEGIFYKIQIRRIRKGLRGHLQYLKGLEKQLIRKAIYVKKGDSDNWELREELLKKWREWNFSNS